MDDGLVDGRIESNCDQFDVTSSRIDLWFYDDDGGSWNNNLQ